MKHGSDLKDYLQSLRGKEIEWGVSDCTMFAANWIVLARDVELNLPKYRSRFGATRLIRQAGDLVTLVDKHLSRAGISPAHRSYDGHWHPNRGDVAVIQTDDYGQVGSIHVTGDIFALRSEDGLICMRPNPIGILKVWSI